MKRSNTPYHFIHKSSAIFMIMALLFLTWGTPSIMTMQQEASGKMQSNQSPVGSSEESNPLNSGTEEKVPNNANSFSEEYLHDIQYVHHLISEIYQYHKCTNSDIYIAFHGELLVPPPNAV